MKAMIDVPTHRRYLEAALEGLVRLNVELMTHRSNLPPIYDSGVRYEREIGTENWLTCEQVYQQGIGDCEDLACWLAAQRRLEGDDEARAIVHHTGPAMWHVRVQLGDGTIEDPSLALGMGAGHGRRR